MKVNKRVIKYKCLQMEEARKCIAELDVDKDGRVSYPEFLLVWKYKSK